MQDENYPTPAQPKPRRRSRRIASAVAIGAAGVAAGGVLAGTLSANAAGADTGTPSYGSSVPPAGTPGGHANGNTDPSKPMRNDEKLLTGTTRAKVLAAVTAKYPQATIQRIETDSDGVYEAHIVNNGTDLTVKVGKAFTITGTQTGGPGGGGDHDGDGPGGAAPSAPAA
jgi:hypothetical protein